MKRLRPLLTAGLTVVVAAAIPLTRALAGDDDKYPYHVSESTNGTLTPGPPSTIAALYGCVDGMIEFKWELIISTAGPAGNQVGPEVFVVLDATPDTQPTGADAATVTGAEPILDANGGTAFWRVQGLDRIASAETSEHDTWGLWSRQRTGEVTPIWAARIMDMPVFDCPTTPPPA